MNELDAIISILQGARQDLQESNLRAFIASLRRFTAKLDIRYQPGWYYAVDAKGKATAIIDPNPVNDPYQDYYRECRKKSGGGVTWVGD